MNDIFVVVVAFLVVVYVFLIINSKVIQIQML